MNAGRYLLVVVFLLPFLWKSHAQSFSLGSYKSEEWGSLRIKDSLRFVDSSGGGYHYRSVYSEGNYSIVGDTVIFHYLPTPDPGTYKIISEKPLFASPNKEFNYLLRFTIGIFTYCNAECEKINQNKEFDYLNEYDSIRPLGSGILKVINKEDSIELGVSFVGNSVSLFLKNEYSKVVVLTRNRDYPIEIELAPFWGKEVALECNLFPLSYNFNKEERVEKYLILKNTKEEIVLQTTIEGKDRVITYRAIQDK